MTEVVSSVEPASKWSPPDSSSFSNLEQLLKQIKFTDADIERTAASYEESLRQVDEVIARLATLKEDDKKMVKDKSTNWSDLERQVAEDLRQRQAEELRRSLVDTTPSTSMSSSSSSSGGRKHKLSDWKYAELRDAINNSQDMELLLACKAEFHRRLRVYNSWKEKNPRDLTPQRSPTITTTTKNTAPHVNPALTMNRYFKVPFCSLTDVYKEQQMVDFAGQQTGVWYAHFNGQWVQRQMELHPDKKPILLSAGQDDFQMCEIPLDQTGLTRKKGAEITEHEFETVWTHLGGKPLPRWCP